jgi:branched-chain amino acid transport system substrate-binding protein
VSIFYPRAFNQMRMLAAAVNKANSTDPTKIALALEDMKVEVFNGGEGFMRKDDHQFFQPMYVVSLGELGPKEPFDEEKTGWGWRTIARLDAKDTVLPTSCKMNRPS